MANTKRIVDSYGRVVEVEIHKDREMDRKMQPYLNASKRQNNLGMNLDSRHASTIGAGKKTGNMKKANAAKEYKGAVTNKAWKKRRHAVNARKVKAGSL